MDETFRRIGPSDLLLLKTLPGASATDDERELMDGPAGSTLRTQASSLTMSYPPTSATCPRCNGDRYYKLAVPVTDPRFGRLMPCECTQAAEQRRIVAAQQALLDQLARELGPKLARCTFENFDVAGNVESDPLVWGGRSWTVAMQRKNLQYALAQAHAFADRPMGWVALFGPPGTGKSHLSAAIANALAQRGQTVSYASVPALMDFLREGIGDYSITNRIRALQDVPVLVLDDLGTEVRDPRTDEWLGKIINHRSLYELPTVISCNAVRTHLEARVADRIDGEAMVLYLVASSYRAKLRKEREKRAS
jgi:DNA replication protein DnaC